MLGERGPQRGLLEADNLYADFVGRDSFYGFLASQRYVLFRDEDFAQLYCLTNGRASVPPSLLATALVLQTFERVSDEEAKQRADYDLRWKVALGIAIDERPFAKSTLQEFRAQLILHEEEGEIFRRSLEQAKRQGYFRGKKKLRLALDTTAILGRGAVKDTYNLLADGVLRVLRVLAAQAGERVESWAPERGFGRYVAVAWATRGRRPSTGMTRRSGGAFWGRLWLTLIGCWSWCARPGGGWCQRAPKTKRWPRRADY
jgi:transposase